ncbi:MAG TPA: hypothetical protein VLD67_02465 [Vicinamibacterales bacterium]|nr:hypothetical protein [Vicinamibacterales bacterium]
MLALPLLLSCGALLVSADASDPVRTGSIVATVTVAPRLSLDLSTRTLRFQVAEGREKATAEVTFSAGMRTSPGREVLLIVEPLADVTGPAGAAALEALVTFAGEGNGGVSGVLSAAERSVAGRWVGGGHRKGRLLFTLRAAPGDYALPIRFLLSDP